MRYLAPWLFVAVWVAGCAPSPRMVHQSNTFFERCHSADYDRQVSQGEREECWGRWLGHYTLGQPPEKVDYAKDRIEQIRSGEPAPALPGMSSSALGVSYTAAFLSTAGGDEGETGASDAEGDSAPERPDARRRRLPSPPSTDGPCASVCTPHWYDCVERCDSPYGACRDACEARHRTCETGCL